MRTLSEAHVGAQTSLARDFACFTTSREFDTRKFSWQEAGPRLQELIVGQFSVEPRAIAFAGQVHGNVVTAVTPRASRHVHFSNCDGLVTAEPGVMLAIRTADCLPIVFVDDEAGVCSAIHAGWKGTLANITRESIAAMERLGARRDRIRGWIGPAVCRDCYQVSEELIGDFVRAHGELGHFQEGRQLDLPMLNQLQARACGLKTGALENSRLCTFTEEYLFHSHRRQGALRGHQYTVCGFLE
ncbi:hypothetical protein BH09SUM1_BH09SUM1_15370 [soil metagenome]